MQFMKYFEVWSRFLVSLCFKLSDGFEKWVLHSFSGRDAFILVIHKHLVKKVNAVLCDA